MVEPTRSIEHDLLALNQRLLDAIDARDWAVYSDLCDPSLTAFEPEAIGNLVRGMDFHQFYFPQEATSVGRVNRSTICSPDVRLMGDVAVVTFVRLTQRFEQQGHTTSTVANEETRIWQRQEGVWKHVHFHRSRCGDVRL
jgi:calcium/calmodulin-dependent protein kinase (CaM kinase) II